MANFKILHIGNIANIAYLTSKLLRKKGIRSDVLCYDYYHVLGSPEWEDAKIEANYGDDFYPDWTKVNLGNFERPRWFYQGPMSGFLAGLKGPRRTSLKAHPAKSTVFLYQKIYQFCYGSSKMSPLRKNIQKLVSIFQNWIIWHKSFTIEPIKRKKYYQRINSLIAEFKKFFPKRQDQLKISDIRPYFFVWETAEKIFEQYDLIQGYSSDPIYPMLIGKHPYIAFEHGTIRDLPFENSPIGRLTALAYRKADLVFITNSDNIKAAKKLGLKNIQPVPHPILEKWHRFYRPIVKRERKTDNLILFCPVRHDLAIKGTDKYIKALPEVIKKTKNPFRLIFLEWGLDVAKIKLLAKKLKVEKYVTWQRVMPRHLLAYWLEKAEIVLDQTILPAMGALAPEVMLSGKPLLMSYKHEVCRWMYPEEPPIVKVHNQREIERVLIKLINNPALRQKIGHQGEKWFKKYHSERIVTQILIDNLKKVMKKYGQ